MLSYQGGLKLEAGTQAHCVLALKKNKNKGTPLSGIMFANEPFSMEPCLYCGCLQ